VVIMDLNNQAGMLAEVSRSLAHADINIEYAYCTATEGQGKGCLIIKAEEPDRTLEILSDLSAA